VTDRILTVTRQTHPSGATVVSVAGELDHHTSPQFSRTLDDTPFGPDAPVVIDLAELAFCDSTGITVLVTAYRRAHATSSPLFFTGTSSHLMRVFHTVGLDKIFTFQPTTEHVLKALPS